MRAAAGVPGLWSTNIVEHPCDWLPRFARQSLGDFDRTDDLDRVLSWRALAAQRDPLARDALFIALAGKTATLAGRFRGWSLAPWQYDDVIQECYFAYLEVLADWQPFDPLAPSGFGRYYLSVFPARLAGRVRGFLGPWRMRVVRGGLPPQADDIADPGAGGAQAEAFAAQLLSELCDQLPPRAARLLRADLAGASRAASAALFGSSPRTLHRQRRKIIPLLRQLLRDTG
jgi:hypothetical protein